MTPSSLHPQFPGRFKRMSFEFLFAPGYPDNALFPHFTGHFESEAGPLRGSWKGNSDTVVKMMLFILRLSLALRCFVRRWWPFAFHVPSSLDLTRMPLWAVLSELPLQNSELEKRWQSTFKGYGEASLRNRSSFRAEGRIGLPWRVHTSAVWSWVLICEFNGALAVSGSSLDQGQETAGFPPIVLVEEEDDLGGERKVVLLFRTWREHLGQLHLLWTLVPHLCSGRLELFDFQNNYRPKISVILLTEENFYRGSLLLVSLHLKKNSN